MTTTKSQQQVGTTEKEVLNKMVICSSLLVIDHAVEMSTCFATVLDPMNQVNWKCKKNVFLQWVCCEPWFWLLQFYAPWRRDTDDKLKSVTNMEFHFLWTKPKEKTLRSRKLMQWSNLHHWICMLWFDLCFVFRFVRCTLILMKPFQVQRQLSKFFYHFYFFSCRWTMSMSQLQHAMVLHIVGCVLQLVWQQQLSWNRTELKSMFSLAHDIIHRADHELCCTCINKFWLWIMTSLFWFRSCGSWVVWCTSMLECRTQGNMCTALNWAAATNLPCCRQPVSHDPYVASSLSDSHAVQTKLTQIPPTVEGNVNFSGVGAKFVHCEHCSLSIFCCKSRSRGCHLAKVCPDC